MDDEVARHGTGRIEQVDIIKMGGWLIYDPDDPQAWPYLQTDPSNGTHAPKPAHVSEGRKCVRVSIEFRL